MSEWWGVLVGRVKPNTTKRYPTQCEALLAFAREAGAGNEVLTFGPDVPDAGRVRWPTDDEEARLLAAAPKRLADLVVFHVETGARKADALRPTWRHVHLPRDGRGAVHFHQTKKDPPRGVPLTKRTRAVLDRIKAGQPDAKTDDEVFLWPDGPGGSLVPGASTPTRSTRRPRSPACLPSGSRPSKDPPRSCSMC